MNQGFKNKRFNTPALLLIMIVGMMGTIVIQTNSTLFGTTESSNSQKTNQIRKTITPAYNPKVTNAQSHLDRPSQVNNNGLTIINHQTSPEQRKTNIQTIIDSNTTATTTTTKLTTITRIAQNTQLEIFLSATTALTLSLTVTRTSLDWKQSTTFTAIASGGVPGYTYFYSGLPPGCTLLLTTSNVYTCTPSGGSSTSAYTVTVTAQDSGSSSVSKSIKLTVYSDPALNALYAITPLGSKQNSADIGQSISFNTSVSNPGSGNLSFSWQGLPNGCNSVNSTFLSCTPTGSATASYGVIVSATDANGYTVNSNTLTFTVYQDPSVNIPSATTPLGSGKTVVDVNQSVTFSTSIISSGSGGITLTWNNLPTGCTTANSNSITCSPTTAGTKDITVTVTDSNQDSNTSNPLTFEVLSDPIVATPTPTIASGGIDIGQTVVFNSSSTGGLSPYSYVWYLSSAMNCAASTTDQISCTPTVSGTFNGIVSVTDSNGFTKNSTSFSYTVLADPTITTPSSSIASGGIDVGQTVTFSITPSAQTTYTITWNGLPSGCSTTKAMATCTPSISGTYTINATITDSNGFSVTSGNISYTVLPDPIITTPNPSIISGNIDVGQSVTFSSKTASGSGGYSFTWKGLPTGCSTANSSTISCTPSGSGTFTINVTVTDSNGFSATSSTITYTIIADPIITTPNPSVVSGNIDVDQSVTFSSKTASGSGGYSYTWNGLPTGCSTTNSSSISCTPSGSGTFTINVTVTDSNGFSVTSLNLVYTVLADPATTAPNPSIPSGGIDVGQTVTFSTKSSSGSGVYNYVWNGLPTGCLTANSSSIICTPSGAGSFTITVTVTDSNSVSITSQTLSYTVRSAVTVNPLSATSSSLDINQNVTFTTTASGGTNTYSYSWKGLPAGCSSVNSNTLNCYPTSNGTYIVNLTITDTNNFVVTSSSVIITVYSILTVGNPIITPMAIDLGQSVQFSSGSVTGGLGPYSYNWITLPAGCSSNGLSSFTCTPTSSGTFVIQVSVKDANGYLITSSGISFTISSTLNISQFSENTSNLDLGQSITFSASVTGGAKIIQYTWNGLPVNCVSTNTASLTCTSSSTGPFSVNITVTDSNGVSLTSSNLVFTIYSDPSVGAVSSTVASGGIDLGQSITFNIANPTGGLSPYAYAWSGLPTGCTNSGKTFVTCIPSAAGTFSIVVTITDANYYQVQSSILTFTILSQPTIESFSVNDSSLDLGQGSNFTVLISGGASPYSYLWVLPSGCSNSNTNIIICNPTTVGNYTVNVTVTDNNGYILISNNITYTVYNTLIVNIPTASVNSGGVDVDQSFNFTSSFSGGKTPVSYTWSGLPTGCSNSGLYVVYCIPTASGTFTVSVTIVDANAVSVQSSALVYHIYDSVSVGTLSASLSSIDVGQTVNFTDIVISGGSGLYTYSWYGLPTGCSSANSNFTSCQPTNSGTFDIKLTVVDSNDFSNTSSVFSFDVYKLPTVTIPVASATNGTVGTAVTFITTGSGGYGSLTYVWISSSANFVCSSSTTNKITCIPQVTGDFKVNVTVLDSNGGTATVTSGTYHVYSSTTTNGNSPTSTSTSQTNSESGNGSSTSKGNPSPGFTSIFTLFTIITTFSIIFLGVVLLYRKKLRKK